MVSMGILSLQVTLKVNYPEHVRKELSVLVPGIARGVCKIEPPLACSRRRRLRDPHDSDVCEGDAHDDLRGPTQTVPQGAGRPCHDGAPAKMRIKHNVPSKPGFPAGFDVVKCEVAAALAPVLLDVLVDIVGCTGEVDGPNGRNGPYRRTDDPHGVL